MDSFLRFVAGLAITIVYAIIAALLAAVVSNAAPNLGGLCAVVVAVGWVAIIVVAFRKDQPWIGFGILAAPFVALLLVTISCFAILNAS